MTLTFDRLRQLSGLLHKEAALLDARRFDDWLALYDADCIYWMPSQPDQTDAEMTPSIIYEDRPLLAMRVERLNEARALVLNPMPTSTHLVTNIEVGEDDGTTATVDSAFLCIEYAGGAQKILSGRQRHELVEREGALRIARKTVRVTGSNLIRTTFAIPI